MTVMKNELYKFCNLSCTKGYARQHKQIGVQAQKAPSPPSQNHKFVFIKKLSQVH